MELVNSQALKAKIPLLTNPTKFPINFFDASCSTLFNPPPFTTCKKPPPIS
ncbi:hypothetical protein HanIR_Chr02g0095251 [Helianthus annuus]|nr:hypothetical protein HanIR_Chr02g0095251 [Helianthus annuus]